MLITKIKKEKGKVITSGKGKTNVFVEFYKKTFRRQWKRRSWIRNRWKRKWDRRAQQQHQCDDENPRDYDRRVANCNQQTLKKCKSPDSNGIRAEDIEACDHETREMVRQIFNEIMKQNEFTPEAWKNKSDTQKGDVEEAGNYRPICSLPALYKLFTTILYSRLYPRLDQIQAEDQAGFRSYYQITDHLATYRMIHQKCHECRIKMWTATIDFMKAFGSNALKSCGIEHDFISLLKKLYRDQKATVLTYEESDMFEIKKGTKQGDPLSSLLFNTVLQKALQDDIPHWQKKKVWESTWVTPIMSASHTWDLLTTCSCSHPQRTAPKMLCEFKRSTEKVWLRIHPGKTKILSNKRTDIRQEIKIGDMKVEILTRGESTKYLGQMITFQQQETTEIRNRIRAAWATFHKFRQELTLRNYLLKHRLQW